MTAFDTALAIVIGTEGGYTADPADSGNWTSGTCGVGECRGTNWGISAAAYPTIDIQSLTQQQAGALYRRDYWNPISGDDLAPPLALLVFDSAVNCGVGRAVQWLQQAVGANPDGKLGPATMAAVRATVTKHGGAALCAEFMAYRLAFMTTLPTWQRYGLNPARPGEPGGWARRLCALPYQSLTMGN